MLLGLTISGLLQRLLYATNWQRAFAIRWIRRSLRRCLLVWRGKISWFRGRSTRKVDISPLNKKSTSSFKTVSRKAVPNSSQSRHRRECRKKTVRKGFNKTLGRKPFACKEYQPTNRSVLDRRVDMVARLLRKLKHAHGTNQLIFHRLKTTSVHIRLRAKETVDAYDLIFEI